MNNASINNKPLISVILPVYNSAEFLSEAIDSILRQTITDFELLIIYDDSDDKSFEIISYFQKIDKRVLLIHGDKKKLIGALNKGISLARGKYIARMDADDISLPQRFKKQIELMEATNADVCGSHWLIINTSGKLCNAKLSPLTEDSFVVFMMFTVPFAHGSVMLRNSFIIANKVQYGDMQFAEDYALWTRLYNLKAKFCSVDDFLFKYREQSSTLSKLVARDNASDARIVRRKFARQNKTVCKNSIKIMIDNYLSLSEIERVYLILASYILMCTGSPFMFLKVLWVSTRKSLAIAALYFFNRI
jgi:glycosyltransferase involved in cell wall biosynthesis